MTNVTLETVTLMAKKAEPLTVNYYFRHIKMVKLCQLIRGLLASTALSKAKIRLASLSLFRTHQDPAKQHTDGQQAGQIDRQINGRIDGMTEGQTVAPPRTISGL